jgi:hypothetical protein
MRVRLTVFGHEVWCLEFGREDPVKTLAQAIEDLVTDDEEPEAVPEQPSQFGWGHAPHIERDMNPMSPDDRYAPWEDGKFGFGIPNR